MKVQDPQPKLNKSSEILLLKKVRYVAEKLKNNMMNNKKIMWNSKS